MRKTKTFKLEDITEESFEKDEVEHAKKYVGEYNIKTLSFGEKNEAQFKAITVNPQNTGISQIDAWKFRFHTLINGLEIVPGFHKRPFSGYDIRTREKLEQFIYNAPAKLGEALQELSDRKDEHNKT